MPARTPAEIGPGPARVGVPLTNLWTSPDAVRPMDAPAIADQPDVTSWVAAMDYDARLALLKRVDTQAEAGELVNVDEVAGDWAKVVLPWQPSRKDPRGYPGWLRTAHLRPESPEPRSTESGSTESRSPEPRSPEPRSTESGSSDDTSRDDVVRQPEPTADGGELLATARRLLGTEYVWGGLSATGIDCSGFAHLIHRRNGVTIPRDASDQAADAAGAGRAVPLDALAPGALIFFGHERGTGPIHHVGFYVGTVDGEPTMLHAPKTGRVVELLPLPGTYYADELCAARSFVAAA